MLSFNLSFERAKLVEKEPVLGVGIKKNILFHKKLDMLSAKQKYNCDVVISFSDFMI